MKKNLRILMCCHLPLKLNLGGAKVYIEAAQVYKSFGHDVTLVGVDEVVGSDSPYLDESWRVKHYPPLLKDFIIKRCVDFDVIEFESIYLPYYLKNEVASLLVARSVLLDLHLKHIKIPRFRGFRSFIGLLLKSKKRKYDLNFKIQQSLETIKNSDFVNVPNPSDQILLECFGVPKDKIIMQPYGIFEERFNYFKKIRDMQSARQKTKKIAFVGTFDNRKGAVEFPYIVEDVIKRDSQIEFKLLGVIGMFPTAEAIRDYLGATSEKNISIIPTFNPEELPDLLIDCTAGVFPSYLESFGFGVLEMMAMGLPVVGYDSPGVNSLLPKELLVKPGDHKGISRLLLRLIEDEGFLHQSILQCDDKVNGFIYEKQKNRSLEVYLSILDD